MAFSLIGALDQTTEWIKESVNEELLSLSETALTPGAENSSKPSLSPTLVLNNSYLKLLQWDYLKKELPEVSGFFPSLKFSIILILKFYLCISWSSVACGLMTFLESDRNGSLDVTLLVLYFHGIELPFLFLHLK